MYGTDREIFTRLKSGLFIAAVALAVTVAGAHSSSAAETEEDVTKDPRYWEIESVEIYEITPMGEDIQLPPINTQPGTQPNSGTQPSTGTGNTNGGTQPGTIRLPGSSPFQTSPTIPYRPIGGIGYGGGWMAIGNWVYEIVRENQATVESQTNRFSVLPIDPTAWEYMEGWTGPHVRTYNVQAKNFLGMRVLDFQYQVIFYANGTADEGGKYVANLQIVPQKVQTAWGYHILSQAEIGDVMNMGSTEDPVAGIHLQIQWNMGSMLRKFQGIHSFFVKGNGEIEFIP